MSPPSILKRTYCYYLPNCNLVLLRGARQLVTLRGPKEARRGRLLRELNIIPDGALLIRNGIIQDVGLSRRVERLASARGAQEIDVTGHVVMPAFVDGLARVAFAHTPLPAEGEAMSAAGRDHSRDCLEGARALKAMARLRLEARCRHILDEMLRHGTGTVEAQTGYPVGDSGEMKTLRVYRALDRNPVDLVATHLASAPLPDCGADHLLRGIRKRKLARFVDVRCAQDGFTPPEARKLLNVARELGFGLKIQAPDPAPDSAVGLAVELGALSISQLDYLSDADVSLLAASQTIATLCPGPAYQAGSPGFAPARALIDRGAAVSLASNFNAETSPFYGMPFILALACRHMGMTPAEAVAAATINGAYAAGRGDRVGSIEPGKQADLVVYNARDYREIPYYAGANPVYMTIKNGAIAYRMPPCSPHD